MAEVKYRPSLTLAQINYLLSLTQSDEREVTQTLREKTIASLKIFSLKADAGLTSHSHLSGRRKTTLDILSDSSETRAQERERLYNLWEESPDLVTREELEKVDLYRYENDLMSPEEEEIYEQGL